MNKTAIKNFAIWARNKLISEIIYKAGLLGISDKGIAKELPTSTDNLKFYDIGFREPVKVEGAAIKQRGSLVQAIEEKAKELDYKQAFDYVVEETAFTWFNRLIAIRFMEINEFLPCGVRVLSSEMAGKNEPDMVSDPFDTDIDFTAADKENMGKLKEDELFRFLFIKECNKLSEYLPELFEKADSFSELLIPLSYKDEDSVVYKLVHDIPEEDFDISEGGQVQIIGWLYQYYNTDLNSLVYDGNMSKAKVPKELISAATTIYTPDWSVKYMVENSLGKLWADSHADFDKSEWKYYLDEAEQEEAVNAELEKIRSEYKNISPEEIKFLDPCMGSGHILVYAFDVLMQIYLSCGYSERSAAMLIVQKNLYGLDIDKRAYQLSYFSLMMKARCYDRRFLDKARDMGVKPSLGHFQGLGGIKDAHLSSYPTIEKFVGQFKDCDTYGSLTEIQAVKGLDEALDDFGGVLNFDIGTCERVMTLYKILSQKYDIVCTNPPYLGSNRFSAVLNDFVNVKYPTEKSDISMAMFRKACDTFAKQNGYIAFITTNSWFFLSSFQKLREYILNTYCIDSIVDYGTELFEGKVGHNPIVSWVLRKAKVNKKITAVRLVDYCYSRRDEKEPEFFNGKNRYFAYQDNFSKIPGAPVAYWVSENFLKAFENPLIGEIASPKKGLDTADNDRFIRNWFEVSYDKIGFDLSKDEAKTSTKKWYPLNSGGNFRKWYGNFLKVINWENDGNEVKSYEKAYIRAKEYYFVEGLSWTKISSSKFGIRYAPKGLIFDSAGQTIFFKDDNIFYILGLMTTNYVFDVLTLLNPTLNYQVGDIANIPVILDNNQKPHIDTLVQENITLSKTDWDSFETSWDFEKHPLLKSLFFIQSKVTTDSTRYKNENVESVTFQNPDSHITITTSDCDVRHTVENELFATGETSIKSAFSLWEQECNERFNKLKANEEELNRIFIDIYGLQNELTPDVEDKDVTVRKADLTRDIKSFVSYAVGCMFGRYSLDVDGLAYAGSEWDGSKYKTYIPVTDNIIPITDEEYFTDDITARFVDFVRIVYGEGTLEQNLDFIANALGSKGNTSRQKIRNYFLNDFIKDHNKIYQKRPIYWLYDSGKQHGFKALIYMHRYTADTTGNVRVDYLHKLQRVYESEIARMQEVYDTSSDNREKSNAEKRKDKLAKQLKEARDYDAKISHLALSRIEIDLDDGVKVNYEKVQTGQDGKKLEILAKI